MLLEYEWHGKGLIGSTLWKQ
ncbi:hypothetical protein FOXB_05220 [Fusarium oxysporum f. sp. conglutinans Fo5176]|uniref:Uncharacterized protein n=1 Tax=Fusarium oxysporum (strain Fo5176) TaxID=660025 RepID=F9FFP1_FUSOF|nr:hypothetical protein FOXB_05220 [Fusarium oxysporum f. sp. conglutinans Fo5176]